MMGEPGTADIRWRSQRLLWSQVAQQSLPAWLQVRLAHGRALLARPPTRRQRRYAGS
jgi:hypothetical protein